MPHIFLFQRDKNGKLVSIKVRGNLYEDSLELTKKNGDVSEQVPLDMKAGSALFGDVLFGELNDQAMVVQPLPLPIKPADSIRNPVIGSEIAVRRKELESEVTQLRAGIERVQELGSKGTDIAALIKDLGSLTVSPSKRVLYVNLAKIAPPDLVNVVLSGIDGGKAVKTVALVDNGAEICLMHPSLVAKSGATPTGEVVDISGSVPGLAPAEVFKVRVAIGPNVSEVVEAASYPFVRQMTRGLDFVVDRALKNKAKKQGVVIT